MFATPAIRNLIREGKNHQIPSFMQSGGELGNALVRPAPRPAGACSRRSPTSRASSCVTRSRNTPASSGGHDHAGYQAVRLQGHRRQRQAAQGPARRAERDRRRRRRCKQQGSVPLSIQEAGVGLGKEITIPGFGGKVKLQGSRHLHAPVRDHDQLGSVAAALARRSSRSRPRMPTLAKAVREVRTDIERGLSLSGSMAKHPKVFPTLIDRDGARRRDRWLPRRRARAHRDQPGEGRHAARQGQVGADLPGARARRSAC